MGRGIRDWRVAWRICFTWDKGNANDVEIVHYHS